MSDNDSPIVRYYSGRGADDRGRTLAQTQALDHNRMEYYHDFIQWMFPLRQPSGYNAAAPVLTDADVKAFHERPELRANLRTSFEAFLSFLGLESVEGGGAVREAEGSAAGRRLFAIPNHNWLRITRVLLCLKTLGLDAECHAFFDYLATVYHRGSGVTADTFAYWSEAARGVAR